MYNIRIDEIEDLDCDVLAVGNDYARGVILPVHQHRRAQLLYGATGQMHVSTRDGEWIVPPLHAVWIPPSTPHAVKFEGVSTRSLYINPSCAARLKRQPHCEVICVSPLLRHLLNEAAALPLYKESERDRALIHLLLLELSVMPARDFDIPLPQHAGLRALCQAFLDTPSIHDPASRWAGALFMSDSAFRRHFLQQTGMSFSAWRQRACVVMAQGWLMAGRSVSNVALSLGYDNGSSFSAMFRRVTGQPPSYYHQFY